MNENNAFRSSEGELRILAERDKWRQRVELRLLNKNQTANKWRYENLEEHKNLFAKTPILCAYVGNRIGDGHNFEETVNGDGSVSASYTSATAERIVGYFDSPEDIRIENINGIDWIVGKGWLWSWYAKELVDKLRKQGLEGMAVSIETLVSEEGTKKEGDVEVYYKWTVLGTTILGDDVRPAVREANIRALCALSENELRRMTALRVASENPESGKYTDDPQNQTKKDEKEQKMSKKLKPLSAVDLQPKFSGYSVLAADNMSVALLSDRGRAAIYTFGEGEDTVLPEKIEEIAVNAVFTDGENTVNVDLEKLIGSVTAKLNAQIKATEELTKENAALKNRVNEMENAEKKRRFDAVKSAVKEQFEKVCKSLNVKISESACDSLLTDESLEMYAAMEKGCEWIGEAACRRDVNSLCMDEITKQNEMRANAAENGFAWFEGKGFAANSEKTGGQAAYQNIVEATEPSD